MVAFLKQHQAPFDAQRLRRVLRPHRGAGDDDAIAATRSTSTAFGSQGPVLLQTLNILETFDLEAMSHNSADYIHTVTEAMKLAYADRDTYYADPAFVKVPGEGLLSKAYAQGARRADRPAAASNAFMAGNPLPFDSEGQDAGRSGTNIADGTATAAGEDARWSCPRPTRRDGRRTPPTWPIIDKDGNVFDITPSGGWIGGAVILGNTGIAMSVRGEQFWLDKTRAAQLRPRARPRYTLTPSIVFKDGQPFMALGHAGRRQPGPDHPAGVPQHRRVLGSLVPEPAQRVRVAALPDAALPRLVLAARRRLQQAERRGDDSRRRLQRAEGARPRREPDPRLQHVGLRDRGADRSGDAEPHRRRRPAARLLRDGVSEARDQAVLA